MAVLSSTRPPASRRKRRAAAQMLAVLAVLACGSLFARAPVSAHELVFPPQPPVIPRPASASIQSAAKEPIGTSAKIPVAGVGTYAGPWLAFSRKTAICARVTGLLRQ